VHLRARRLELGARDIVADVRERAIVTEREPERRRRDRRVRQPLKPSRRPSLAYRRSCMVGLVVIPSHFQQAGVAVCPINRTDECPHDQTPLLIYGRNPIR